MRVALVANPRAGRGSAGRAASELIGWLVDLGIEASIVQPEFRHVRSIVSELVDRVDVVVACGGDGTVHQVLQGVVGTPVGLGILPAGTGNDIARELHMARRDPRALAEAIAANRMRPVDLGHASTADGSTAWFLGVLSTGFDSTVNERANRMRWPTGRSRYLAGVAAELPRFRPLAYEVEVDDERSIRRGMLVCVANAGSYGGGMRVCPDAAVDDGALDITWLDEVGTLEFVRVLPSVFSGAHVRHWAVRTGRGTRVRVSAPGQVAYADGERIGPLPVRIDLHPGVLRVLDLRPT